MRLANLTPGCHRLIGKDRQIEYECAIETARCGVAVERHRVLDVLERSEQVTRVVHEPSAYTIRDTEVIQDFGIRGVACGDLTQARDCAIDRPPIGAARVKVEQCGAPQSVRRRSTRHFACDVSGDLGEICR
jgi:hypothetical protein